MAPLLVADTAAQLNALSNGEGPERLLSPAARTRVAAKKLSDAEKVLFQPVEPLKHIILGCTDIILRCQRFEDGIHPAGLSLKLGIHLIEPGTHVGEMSIQQHEDTADQRRYERSHRYTHSYTHSLERNPCVALSIVLV